MDDALFVIVSVFLWMFEKVTREMSTEKGLTMPQIRMARRSTYQKQDQFKIMEGRPGKEMSLFGMICPFAG